MTPDGIVRKLRLIALTTLAARSEKQQLTYAEVAAALQVDEKEVEPWVIEGESTIHAHHQPGVRRDSAHDRSDVGFPAETACTAIGASLLRARLSQPQSLIRITYVSSRAAPSFGQSEWQLLEKRLGQWQKVVGDARKVVEEAEELAAQGPITHRARTQGQGSGQGRREEEVAA